METESMMESLVGMSTWKNLAALIVIPIFLLGFLNTCAYHDRGQHKIRSTKSILIKAIEHGAITPEQLEKQLEKLND